MITDKNLAPKWVFDPDSKKDRPVCPECELPLFVTHHEGSFAYPECVVYRCECGYESDPE